MPDAKKAIRPMTTDTSAAFLATLTRELLPVGWQRIDQVSLGRPSTEYRFPGHVAVLTVARDALNGLNVHLFSGEIDIPWRVTADEPDPLVIAAAANATVNDSECLCTPLADLLAAAGWHHEEGESWHGAAENHWVSPDGQREAVQLSSDCHRLNDWLIEGPPTERTSRRSQYVTSAYTPRAVLAAIALGDAP